MNAVSPTTVAEYLRRDDKPEPELIAGELIPKPMGALEHMRMERRLEQLLLPFEERGLGQVMRELSFRHGDDVRIPDVVFFSSAARFQDGILVDAPLLCVEILSPSQRLADLFAKCEVYRTWGVAYCWVIDPIGKHAWEHDGQSPIVRRVADSLNAGEIAVSVDDLFR